VDTKHIAQQTEPAHSQNAANACMEVLIIHILIANQTHPHQGQSNHSSCMVSQTNYAQRKEPLMLYTGAGHMIQTGTPDSKSHLWPKYTCTHLSLATADHK
jgi:hypothetical protein